MADKVKDAAETRRQKAKNLRYRKAIAKDLNFEAIQQELYDIGVACDEVSYFIDSDDETLIDALDGDDDEAYEFRIMFADLSAECEQMQYDLNEWHEWGGIPDCFDDFFVAIGGREELLGYDIYEGDYYGLDECQSELAVRESRKRLERMTKAQIIEAAQCCFRVFRAYIGLQHRYDCIKAAMDILHDENTGYLQTVRQIEETYDRAEKDTWGFVYKWGDSYNELDRLLKCMPQEAWVQ